MYANHAASHRFMPSIALWRPGVAATVNGAGGVPGPTADGSGLWFDTVKTAVREIATLAIRKTMAQKRSPSRRRTDDPSLRASWWGLGSSGTDRVYHGRMGPQGGG